MLTGISLFSGAGGLDIAAKLAGIKTVCYVENDPYAQGVLMSRMRDGGLDAAPIFEDVRTFRGTSLRGSIDVVSGGFPCQDLSVAGKQAGIEAGARSGLWKEFARIIREVAPRFVCVENVPGLLFSGMGRVLGDLAEMGFDAQWQVLSAAGVGAPHLRERVFIVAYSQGQPRQQANSGNDSDRKQREPWGKSCRKSWDEISSPSWKMDESDVLGKINGVAYRLDRVRCTGNGVIPQCAKIVFDKIIEMSGVKP